MHLMFSFRLHIECLNFCYISLLLVKAKTSTSQRQYLILSIYYAYQSKNLICFQYKYYCDNNESDSQEYLYTE